MAKPKSKKKPTGKKPAVKPMAPPYGMLMPKKGAKK